MQPPTIEMETKEQQPLVPSKPTSKKFGSRMLGTFTQVANSKRKLKRMTTIKRQQTQILSKVNLLSETIEHERRQLADDVFTSAAVYASETGVAKLVQLCESHLKFAHQLQQQASQISERKVQTTVPVQPSMSDVHRQATPSLPKTIHRNEILAECVTKFPQIANKLRIAKQMYDRIAIQQNETADKIDREKTCPYPDSQQTFCNNRHTLQQGKSAFPVVPCAKQVASVETMENQQFRIGNNKTQQVQCRTDEEQQVQCRTDEEQQVQCRTDEKQQIHCPEPIKLTAKHVSQTGIGTQLGTWLETILNSKAVDIQLDSTSIAKAFSIVQAAMHYVQHENSRECLSLGNLSLQFQHWFQNLLHRVICASQIEQNHYNRLIEERRFSIAPLQKSVSRTRHMWKKLKWSTEPRLIQIQKKLRIESLQLHNAHKVMQLEHRWLQLVSRDLKLFALKTAAVEAKRLQNFHNENRMMEQRVRIDKIRKAASIDNDIDLRQVHIHLEEVKRILQSIEATNMLTTSHAEVQPNESEFEWLGYQQACQKWKNSKAGEWKLVKQKATNPFIPISYNNLLRCIAWKYKPKSLSLRMLTKTVTEILLERLKLEKEEQSNSSLSASNQVVSLRNFVYDFFLAKFSSRKVAECRVLDFITAISKVTSSTSWWLSTFRVCAQIPSRSSITELRNQRLKERMAATEVERSMKQNTITLSGKSTEQVESTTGSQLKTKLIESSKRIRRMPTRRHSSSSASSKSTSRKKSTATQKTSRNKGTTTQTTSSNKGTTASYESHRKHSTLSTKQLENQEQSALDRFKYLTTKKMDVDNDSEIDFNLILLVVATLFGNSNGTPFIESRQTGVLWVPEQVAHEATAELFSHMDQKQVGKLQAEVLYNRSKWIKVRTGGGKKEAQRIEENSIPFEVYLKVLISKLSELSNRTKHGIAMWFTIVDIQNRGYLDYDQVSAVVRAISPQLSKFQVTKLYRIAVQSGNNTAQAQIPDLVVAALQLGITLPGLNSHDDQYGVASIGPRASLKPEYHDNPSVSMSAMHLEWKRNRDEIYQHINDLQQRAKTPNQVVVVEEHRTRVEQLELLMKRNTQAYPAWCLYRLIAYSLKRTKKVAGLSSTLHCIQYITKWKSRIKNMLDRANETSFGVQRSGPSATKSFVALLRQRIEMRRANGETQDHPVFSCVRWKRVHELNKWFSEPELNLMTLRDRNRNTVLHVAVQNGHREIVTLLLDKGAQVNVQNLSGQTPLHFSKMYGYRSISHYLKRSGARDDIKNNFGDCARDIPST